MAGSIMGSLQDAGGYIGTAYYLNTGKKPIKSNTNQFYVATQDGQARVKRDGSEIGAPDGPYEVCIAPKTGDGKCGAEREWAPGAVKFSFFGYATGSQYSATIQKGIDGFPAKTTHLGIRQKWTSHGIDFADVLINGISLADHKSATDVATIKLVQKNGDGIEYSFPGTYNIGPKPSSTDSQPSITATKNIKIKVTPDTSGAGMWVDFLFEADDFMGPNYVDKYFMYDPDITYRSSATDKGCAAKVGDGKCNPECATEHFGYDGGDCEEVCGFAFRVSRLGFRV